MSNQIDTSFVKQFSANVFHLSQQKGSRLQGTVRNESQKGESAFYDRIGSVTAVEKSGRHQDTPQLDTPHSRRRVTLVDYVYADLIDSADKIRSLNDPTNDYVQAAVWSLGRRKDQIIIDAANGNAFSGKDGATSVALPNAQKLHSVSGAAKANLNVQALRRAKRKFDAADVDESMRRYCIVKAEQLESLLSETEVTSSDFNTVKALVQGEINTFLGFEFIRTQLLNDQSGALLFDSGTGEVGGAADIDGDASTKCICYAMDGLLMASGMDINARVSERDDKNYSTQIFAEMGMGATRMEEVKVVEIFALDS